MSEWEKGKEGANTPSGAGSETKQLFLKALAGRALGTSWL